MTQSINVGHGRKISPTKICNRLFLVSLVFFGINFCWLSKSSDFEETITWIISLKRFRIAYKSIFLTVGEGGGFILRVVHVLQCNNNIVVCMYMN